MSIAILASINRDLVAQVAQLPMPGETVASVSFAYHPGGKGANQAIAAARLGGDVALWGAVGDDAHGPVLQRYLADAGIDLKGCVVKPGVPTGQAMIAVDAAGANMIIVVAGANGLLTPADLDRAPIPARATGLATFESPPATVQAFLAAIKAGGGRTLVNPAPVSSAAVPVMEAADIIIVNEHEVAAYAGAADSLADQARCLITRADQSVIVTLGAQGALLVSARSETRIAGHVVEAVDTTGAGDCFCGALACALDHHGLPLAEAAALANRAAALSVTRRGAGPSMPTLVELRES